MEKKKIISAVALTVLTIGAVSANYWMSSRPASLKTSAQPVTPVPQETPVKSDFYQSYRQQRQENLDEETAQLEMILNDPQTDEITRKAAQEQLMLLVEEREAESAIEAVLQAKGIQTVAVVIHKNTASLIVEERETVLDDASHAMILSICCEQYEIPPENVKIIPVKAQDYD